MSTEAAKRFVPGAPPPTPVSKSQKKKRRAVKKDEDTNSPEVSIPDTNAAALTEKAPAEQDVKSGAVAEELVAHAEPAKEEQQPEQGGAKPSPVIDLLNKRAKQLHKKITRIHAYSDKPASQLNDDQKKTLATLPSLEAVVKELDEARKAIETLEAENAKEAARKRAEAAEAEKQRIAEALEATQKAHATRTAQILDFIRLHSLLSSNDPSVQVLNLVDEEVNAIFVAGSALLAHEAESKQDAVSGFLLGEGEVTGITYLRLLEITENYINPSIPEESPVEVEESVEEADAEAPYEAEAEAEADAIPTSDDAVELQQTTIGGLPPAASFTASNTGVNFSFMQASELEQDPVSFENGAEWIEKEDIAHAPEATTSAEAPVEVIEEPVPTEEVQTQAHQAQDGAIDWADDEEGGLPSIDGLHATFGTSGTATPAAVAGESAPPASSPDAQPKNAWATVRAPAAEPTAAKVNGAPNGHQTEPVADEDGFVPASRGTRGRGRARGGFRGNERGSGFRGGDRGSFRGNFRGGRGKPFTGGENGGYRGNSDGEHRGRGRGRGRGFDRGSGVRGGGPRPAPTEA